MRQIIQGACPSKSNCYQIVKHGPVASLAKTKALKAYEQSFYLQCNHYRNANLTGLLELYIDVYYPANRADLDNSLKVVLDCLQHVKALPNDNKVVKIVAQKFVDKENPRIEFTLTQI